MPPAPPKPSNRSGVSLFAAIGLVGLGVLIVGIVKGSPVFALDGLTVIAVSLVMISGLLGPSG